MAGIKIDVEVDDADVMEMFAGIRTRVADVTPAWEVFASVFAREEEMLFDTQGASAGTPWDPLSPPYASWKTRVRPGEPTLVFDGDLRDSLTNRPLAIERLHANYAEVGTDDETAGFHQYGTKHMPARPPVETTPFLVLATVDALADWILEGR